MKERLAFSFVVLITVNLSFPTPSFSLEPPKRVQELGKEMKKSRSKEVQRPRKMSCQWKNGKRYCTKDSSSIEESPNQDSVIERSNSSVD